MGVLTRRRFLLSAAATVAGGLPAVRRPRPASAETPITTLVLVMQENRSFDHYFGRFPNADGLPAGAPARPATTPCLHNPPHDETAFQSLSSGVRDFTDPASLTYFGERDIPFYWALARRFTLCDRYFASALGPTFPNRLYGLAGSAGGYHGNPSRIDPALLPRPTLVDRLDAAGVDWACYMARLPDAKYNPVAYYPERQSDPRAARTFREFMADAAAGRLPSVAWVVGEDPLMEHPPSPPQWGQRFVALTVHALASGPQWHRSALVLNYDESGGFYDHVRPPQVDERGYGFRVPCIVVSPYAKPGHVSHATYDHTSALALAERTFGLAPLTARDAAADPFEDCFDFSRPTHAPISYAASVGGTACAVPPAWAAELLREPLPPAALPRRSDALSATTMLEVGGLGLAALAGAAAGLAAWRGRRAR